MNAGGTDPELGPARAPQGKGRGIPPWKRALDLICIALALPLVLVVGVALALFIVLVSPGPILFKQFRIGYGGRRFLCFKFRTMVVNAETTGHRNYFADLIESNRPMRKLDEQGDRRLVRGGRLIRALGLDELPQLLNVARGEMSLVGPRPCLPYEYECYQPRHRQRCDTAPGLTGLWQVSGKNKLTFEEMIELDLQYLQRRSLRLDLTILARTVPTVLGEARGALARRWANRAAPWAAGRRERERERERERAAAGGTLIPEFEFTRNHETRSPAKGDTKA